MRCPKTPSTDIQIIEICKLIKEIVLHTNSGRWKYGLFERQIVAYQKEQTENQHRQSYHDIEHLLRYLFGRQVG